MGLALNMGYENTGAQVQLNMRDSMALTMQHFISQGQAFTKIVTTRQFMMTTAMVSFYAFLDSQNASYKNAFYDSNVAENANFRFALQWAGDRISMDKSANPHDPNFMVFYFPPLKAVQRPRSGCL